MGKIRKNFCFDREVLDQLDEVSTITGLSESWLVGLAIRDMARNLPRDAYTEFRLRYADELSDRNLSKPVLRERMRRKAVAAG